MEDRCARCFTADREDGSLCKLCARSLRRPGGTGVNRYARIARGSAVKCRGLWDTIIDVRVVEPEQRTDVDGIPIKRDLVAVGLVTSRGVRWFGADRASYMSTECHVMNPRYLPEVIHP